MADIEAPPPADLSAVPVVGITPRRMSLALGAVVAVWVAFAFARQVGAAADAARRAEDLRLSNARLASEVAALQQELQVIQRRPYISVEMRRYGLGRAKEIPFTLAAGAPALGPDAPGSAAARLGEDAPTTTPLESWLSLLFGPTD
ncbi:MAG TPA: hypothetical protein VH813_06290 [Candidatus Limnocylindrales bacterium]|jgi:hypothetical protein